MKRRLYGAQRKTGVDLIQCGYNSIRSIERGEEESEPAEEQSRWQRPEEKRDEEESQRRRLLVIINALILITLIIGLLTRADKRKPVLIFIVPALLFQVGRFAEIIPDNYFHLIACYLDLVVIAMLVKWSRVGFLSLFLGAVSAVSVFANAAGWMAYDKGLDPLMYDGAYMTMYSLVLIVSLMEWSSGARTGLHHLPFRSHSN
jgi:hypothetical protein